MTFAQIDQFEFDVYSITGNITNNPTMVKVADRVYAIAYSDGRLVTVGVDNKGNITEPIIDSYEFDALRGYLPYIIHISGNIYAIAYEGYPSTGSANDGWVVTVEISPAGIITKSIIDSLMFFYGQYSSNFGLYPHIAHVSGDIYVIAYTKTDDGDGWICTVSIDSAGAIGAAVIDSYEFDTSLALSSHILKISGTTYAIVYLGPGSDGWLKTLTIANDGTIAASPQLDSFEFDPVFGVPRSIVKVSGDIYAIAYRGTGGEILITVDIDSAGNITEPAVDTLVFDTYLGDAPIIIELSSGLFAIAYLGPDGGMLVTIPIGSDGTIGSITQSLGLTHYISGPFIIAVTSTIVAVAYSGSDWGGRLTTVGVAKGYKGNPNVDQLMYQHVERME